MDFQPRLSSRIAGELCGLNTEEHARHNLMRKLGLISGDEAPSMAALEAYHKLFEVPLSKDMIEAIGELYRWTLSAIREAAFRLLRGYGGWPQIGRAHV